ncbi:hypothetical protein [Paenibacillus polymyxa]|uniref:hypothetical protein n=1 Tax=Paenibacillus polymyxa TaxID=1406 RepID=UPI002ED50E37|nr:hypothetical protein [Paenibacillus polymyxa]
MEMLPKIIKYLIMYVPAILGLHAFLYSKYPKYYFFFLRILSKWRDTTWSVNVNYKLAEVDGAYQKIETILKDMYKSERYKRSVNMVNKKYYECGRFNILIQDDFNTGELSSNTVFVRIPQLNVTLNNAEEVLRELRELFNTIERQISPLNSMYNMDVQFKAGQNPFYGLMVQRLGKSNVEHFECVFPISSIVSKNGGNDRNRHFLRVFKEKMTINEGSFDILEETAKRALLFK